MWGTSHNQAGLAKIETPTTYDACLVNGTTTVPMLEENLDYIAVQEWEAEDNTIEPAYTQEEIDSYIISANMESITASVNAIEVSYNGNVFSGSYQAQVEMTAHMQVLFGKADTVTRNYFTVDKVKVKLSRDDFDNILDIIEPIFEALTDI